MKYANIKCFNLDADKEFVKKALQNGINKCRLFDFNENQLFFISDYHEPEEFTINLVKVKLNDVLCKQIIKVINDTHKIVPSIKTSSEYESQNYDDQFPTKIESIVNSLVNTCLYEEWGLLKFLSHLLIRIARAHAWHNGNKRTAIVSISRLLDLFGFYMIWASDNTQYISTWESLMYKIVSPKDIKDESTLMKEDEAAKIVEQELSTSVWISISAISSKKL